MWEGLATNVSSLWAPWEGRHASVHCGAFPINVILMVDLGCIFPRVMEILNNIHIMVDGPVVFGLLV